MKSKRNSDLFLLVNAGDDDVHLRSHDAVRNDAAAECTGVLDLWQTCPTSHSSNFEYSPLQRLTCFIYSKRTLSGYTPWVKKQDTLLLPVTLPYVDRFLQYSFTIGLSSKRVKEVVVTEPTTPHMSLYYPVKRKCLETSDNLKEMSYLFNHKF